MIQLYHYDDDSVTQLKHRATRIISALSKSPMVITGRAVPELKPSVYRETLVAPVRVIYRQDEKRLVIVHVVRHERELRSF